MAYEKQTWECGETITADKLNHMEDGIANSGGGSEPLIFTITHEEIPCPNNPDYTTVKSTYSHSWQEIHDALMSGRQVLYLEGDEENALMGQFQVVSIDSEEYPDHPYLGVIGWFSSESSLIVPMGFEVFFSNATSKEFIADCAQE